MNTISEIMNTTEFWFVAVFVGLCINLIASFLKDFIKKVFAKLNNSWDSRNEKSKLKREKELQKYSTSYQQLYLGRLELNHKKLTAVNEFIVAAVLLLFGMAAKPNMEVVSTIASIGALLSVFAGLMASISHGRFMLLILDAEYRLARPQLNRANKSSE